MSCGCSVPRFPGQLGRSSNSIQQSQGGIFCQHKLCSAQDLSLLPMVSSAAAEADWVALSCPSTGTGMAWTLLHLHTRPGCSLAVSSRAGQRPAAIQVSHKVKACSWKPGLPHLSPDLSHITCGLSCSIMGTLALPLVCRTNPSQDGQDGWWLLWLLSVSGLPWDHQLTPLYQGNKRPCLP